ncbi:type VI secretion system-associated FHA domain protein TagH [Pseudoalteromonas mariniglutinosa]|uniref:type VI secretion system-associated FHA domain protein TagH n=1 Tax=Pseudoalteromonas mariniglutinosa TaxID=206042 RepID=UPI00384C956C
MEVVLNVTSYHRLSPEIEASKTVKNSLTFGRSLECDWHLPDPEKIISSKHGKIAIEGDSFYVYDYSTNGLFVNFSVTPLGKDNKHRIQDGDVLTIGDFQVEAKLASIQQPNKSSNEPITSNSHYDPFVNNGSFQNSFNASSVLDEAMDAPILKNIDIEQHSHIPEDWDALSLLGDTTPVDKPCVEEVVKQPTEHSKKADKVEQTISVSAKTDYCSSYSTAFLQGLGINAQLAESFDNEQLWLQMGQGFNLLLMGMMDMLRQRAAIKNQLKVNHTMFQSAQNNPLKFSATIDDAIQNLFMKNSASFLSSSDAINESFADTKSHEKALMAGVVGVLNGLLEQLSPTNIEQQAVENSGIMKHVPRHIDATSWKLYQNLYSEIASDVNSKGAMALSDDFLRAYNREVK